jgi:hypothetical protein
MNSEYDYTLGMRCRLVPVFVGTLFAVVVPAAAAKTNACRSVPEVGYELRVSEVGCKTARSVQRAYFESPLGTSRVVARGRTWRCSHRILEDRGYDPTIVGHRVTGRVLCIHIANRGRFVRWKYRGGGD